MYQEHREKQREIITQLVGEMKHNLSVRLVNVEGRGADITEKPDDCTNTARGIAVRQTKAEQNVFFFW